MRVCGLTPTYYLLARGGRTEASWVGGGGGSRAARARLSRPLAYLHRVQLKHGESFEFTISGFLQWIRRVEKVLYRLGFLYAGNIQRDIDSHRIRSHRHICTIKV